MTDWFYNRDAARLLRGTCWVFQYNSGWIPSSIGSGRQWRASHHRWPGSIQGQCVWDLWWAKWHWEIFFSEYCGFPCQYHSNNAPHSSSSTCCSYQKDKWANPDTLTKRSVLSIIGEHWIENFRLFPVFKTKFQPLYIMMVTEKACISRGKNVQTCLHNSQL
jgi:hypothetical protein